MRWRYSKGLTNTGLEQLTALTALTAFQLYGNSNLSAGVVHVEVEGEDGEDDLTSLCLDKKTDEVSPGCVLVVVLGVAGVRV